MGYQLRRLDTESDEAIDWGTPYESYAEAAEAAGALTGYYWPLYRFYVPRAPVQLDPIGYEDLKRYPGYSPHMGRGWS